jgi:hypothetical protein
MSSDPEDPRKCLVHHPTTVYFMNERRVVKVIAHKFCDNDLLYRVQWNTHEVEWVSGHSIDIPACAIYLLRYWKNDIREVDDKPSQTGPCRMFEFPEFPSDGSRTFVPFTKSVFDERLTNRSRIPVSVDDIDFGAGVALVRYQMNSEPKRVLLEDVRGLVPRLIAQFLVARANRRFLGRSV